MQYKAKIEVEFDSELPLHWVKERLEICLVERSEYNGGVISIALDNTNSENLSVLDYTLMEVE